MAGSPKKRAKREAERIRRLQVSGNPTENAAPQAGESTSVRQEAPALPPSLPVPAVLHGEVLPPAKAAEQYEITRTALKRAMRKRAQEYAEKAIDRLAKNLDSADAEIAGKAANDLLKWAFGQPATEIETSGDGGLSIGIIKFGVEQ